MTDGERLQKFDADFEKLKKNREKVPLEQLRTRYADAYNALVAEVQAGSDWFAETYIDLLVGHFPRHPRDAAGNEWLDKHLAAIREQEAKPGGRVERYRAALLERLDMKEYRQLAQQEYSDYCNFCIRVKDIHFAWDYMKESKAVLRGLRLYREGRWRRFYRNRERQRRRMTTAGPSAHLPSSAWRATGTKGNLPFLFPPRNPMNGGSALRFWTTPPEP